MAENIGDCGYWRYLGDTDVPRDESGSSVPRVLTRCEKGQALTHLEMDFNLASLFHTLETSSKDSSFAPEESSESTDVYFERRKPTREEEMEGMFVTFSYAPICKGSESVIQNKQQVVKVQHTTDEIRYKLSNEQIPGTLDVREDFHVTGSIFTSGGVQSNALNVNGTGSISKDLIVGGTASIKGDLYLEGNLYVNGVMFGNLSQEPYNSLSNPNYAEKYVRWGVQDTGSQSDARLKLNRHPIYDPLVKLEQLEGYEFDWAPEAEKEGHDVGLIAQELQYAVPEAVSEGADGYLRVDYKKVIPLLVAAVKRLSWEVENLKNQAV